MRHDRDRLDDLVGALLRLRRTSGGGAYDDAVAAARAAVARTVLDDAERRVGVARPAPRSWPSTGGEGRPDGPVRAQGIRGRSRGENDAPGAPEPESGAARRRGKKRPVLPCSGDGIRRRRTPD